MGKKGSTWSVSVRELAEFVWRRGDLGSLSNSGGRPTMQQGSAGHRWLQQSRAEQYQAEVFLKEKAVSGQIALEVSGRADGIFLNTTPSTIEEIKTTHTPLIFIDREHNPLHWAQAKLYGALYLQDGREESVFVQLTYFNMKSGEIRSFKQHFTRAELRGYFAETVACYCEWLELVSAWQVKRDAAFSELRFPYPKYRDGQQELAAQTASALETDTPLFVEAQTGSGKTMAILYGALEAFSRQQVHQIVYLTAKTVGRLSVERAVLHLRKGGARLKNLSLVSREGICPLPDAECRAVDCQVAKGHYDRLPQARIALFERETTSRKDVIEVAEEFRVCPHALQMELVSWVDIVIGDYNYFFDPTARIASLVNQSSAVSRGLLIDEAHNLVERAREMYSASIESTVFSSLASKLDLKQGTLKTTCREVARTCREVARTLKTLFEDRVAFANCGPVLPSLPQNLLYLLEQFRDVLGNPLETFTQSQSETLHDCSRAYFEVVAFLQAVRNPASSNLLYLEKRGRQYVLKSFCVDPSRYLSDSIRRSRAKPVFFSGTLTPLSYFARVLTSKEPFQTLKLPSPFPTENCGAFFIRGVSTRYAKRKSSAKPIANIIRQVALVRQGNYMVFFPSYEYMDDVVRLVDADIQNQNIELTVQRPGMSESQKEDFLAKFRTPRGNSLVGFAVLGGLFGEGIDLVGERLSGAILVSPGLPKICLERELVRQHFDQKAKQGFEFAYLYPGINKVLQAAGRVIRTDTDKGILVFIGERFHAEAYRSLLPPAWQSGASLSDLTGLGKALDSFWQVAPAAQRTHSDQKLFVRR